MIDLYDGNNVMRRAMEKHQLGAARPLTLRQRYEETHLRTPGSQIWVWDGYNHNDRRREIYPQYKMNRTPPAEDIFAQIKLFRDVLKLAPVTQIAASGWESDDVISTLARKFAKNGVPVTIHSNDMDYGQLADLPNVTLNGVNTKGIPGRWIALYKAMVGDPADNIAGIAGFGPKSWTTLEDQWPQIERAIVAGTPAGFAGLPFKPSILAWLSVQENIELLQRMLTVTHFIDVPDDEIEGGIYEGKSKPNEARALLGKFFL